jgi:hypothetical protein
VLLGERDGLGRIGGDGDDPEGFLELGAERRRMNTSSSAMSRLGRGPGWPPGSEGSWLRRTS